MGERERYGCEDCRAEWGHWRADDKRTYVDRVATSASTGDELFRCNDCGQWWSYHVLDGRPRPRTDEEAAALRASIEANP
jgi:hypothetical protein